MEDEGRTGCGYRRVLGGAGKKALAQFDLPPDCDRHRYRGFYSMDRLHFAHNIKRPSGVGTANRGNVTSKHTTGYREYFTIKLLCRQQEQEEIYAVRGSFEND